MVKGCVEGPHNDTENTSTVKSHSLTALDVSPWAKEYLATTLLKLQAEDGGVTAKISKLLLLCSTSTFSPSPRTSSL
ncbi:hypothetical protein HYQ46_001988 [Verticillium longisporum]|nr:hypothetical protein HYQ46_001988 [Verticillium longisporum]